MAYVCAHAGVCVPACMCVCVSVSGILKRAPSYACMEELMWSPCGSCLMAGLTMAGWGIPVGCIPDGPSIRE